MDKPKSPLAFDRDGTSQAQRLLPALLTDYVAIDERSLKDQLALAHEFAKELKYFDFDNVEAGDWQGLINPEGLAGQEFEGWLKQIEHFAQQPENYAGDNYYNLHRPHFVLFLTFLQLLKNTQAQLNQLTARHLEFYYREVLKFTPKPPQPDHVNILAIPSSQIGSALLPAGTLLAAGKDSSGKDRVYSTDRDLIVNHATITRLSSVYVNKQIIGIREARNPDSDTMDQVLEMLKIALGEPAPGDDLPPYPPDKKVVPGLLASLQQLLEFVVKSTGLYMEPRDLRSLMAHKNNAANLDSDWEIINNILTQAGINRTADPSFTLNNSSPGDRNFDDNLKKALGVQTLTNYFPSPEGNSKFNDLDSFYKALLNIETYFYMPMEDFRSLMRVANKENPTSAEWDNVYELLILAHQNKVLNNRAMQLNQLLLNKTTADAVIAMMRMALGVTDYDPDVLKNKMIELGVSDITIIDTALTLQNTNLPENGWNSIISKLQAAWLNRDPIPAPQLSEWFSITAFSDALSARDSDNNPGRWHTFGQRQAQIITANNNPPTTATIGWAISSPLLSLAQGQRTVALTLVFKPETFNDIKINSLLNNLPFRVEFSSAKGWISAKKTSVSSADYPGSNAKTPSKSLKWEFTFDESAPAITTLPDTDENAIKALWPALRLVLQPRFDGNRYITDYLLFGGLLLEKVLLTVKVNDLTECKLQNDIQTLPSGKPFEPFGSTPAIGSRLYFAHPELAIKKLDQLEVTLQWMGVPSDNLGTYYQNYSPAISGNSAFKSKVALVDQRQELILNDAADLFDSDKATNPATLKIPGLTKTTGAQQAVTIAEAAQQSFPDYRYERLFNVSIDDDVTAWSRFWFLELSGCDFQHAAYPSAAATQAITLANVIANNAIAGNANPPNSGKVITITPGSFVVNPPYTPKLKNLGINYTASIELLAADSQNQGNDQIYHCHPFGYAQLPFDQQAEGHRFLPSYDNEGELYIGLSGVQAPQMLSMLLQLAEGTANPDLEPATVQWSVLNGNAWQTLDQGQLQKDSTNGLLQSGIVKLQLDAVAPNTLLPAGLYWLRAAIDQRCDSVCDSVGFYTQAVSATFMNQENANDHYDQPLPAKTIENLVEPLAAISGITQPYTSYGARPMEQDSRLNNRISERLRHKQRAVSHWDYERLVLEQFPGIYKAKCIPTGLDEIPGQITVVVIPDVRNRLPFNPFEPKASASVLADIKAYLMAHAPMGVVINVKNAYYQQVRLRFAVRFQPGSDSGFYKQQLNEDVNHFLSPWAYEQGKDIVIGGKIYANAIIDFMERRPYVDFVANFKFFRGNDNNAGFTFITKPDFQADVSSDGYAVTATRPDAVLVAVRNHDIDLVTDINFVEQLSNQGIGYMEIELDFQVG